MARYRFVKGFKVVPDAVAFLSRHDLDGEVYTRLPKSDTRELYRLYSTQISTHLYPVIAVWTMPVDCFFIS